MAGVTVRVDTGGGCGMHLLYPNSTKEDTGDDEAFMVCDDMGSVVYQTDRRLRFLRSSVVLLFPILFPEGDDAFPSAVPYNPNLWREWLIQLDGLNTFRWPVELDTVV